ncbi:MAG: SpoIVB peptidase [Eubacterium sp.]|jgi:stage IV sporulation protein B|nr:SpoIVB peptidase [Eubacterium sp.]
MKRVIRILDVLFALILTVIYTFVIAGSAMMPDTMIVRNSKDRVIGKIYSVSALNDESVDFQSAKAVGTNTADLKLLGIIPVKSEEIVKAQTRSVIVSGQPFGIKLYTNGVIVVGTKDINVNGKTVNPAMEAGIQVGDIIISINNKKVYSSDEVEEAFNNNNGTDYVITVKRNEEYKTYTLTPVYLDNEGCFKAGMWVRDSTAGIGTITFFNPAEGTVAALGHPITDVDTGEIMPILNGEAVETTVTSVIKSTNNETGSLCCDFLSKSIGSLVKNTQRGIFGEYTAQLDMSVCSEYEVASPQETEKGFAQIICTVDENGPQVYSAEIVKISYNEDVKNMIIKITDDALIEKTGGIIQGMSGSPIIQNGKLIGAITHVIVNNPLKGYAIFAQTMLEESEF